MRSAGAPTATVLTIMTLVFAPMLGHSHGNGDPQKLVAHTTTTLSVPCVPGNACPAAARYNGQASATDASQAAIDAATASAVASAVADFKAGVHGH